MSAPKGRNGEKGDEEKTRGKPLVIKSVTTLTTHPTRKLPRTIAISCPFCGRYVVMRFPFCGPVLCEDCLNVVGTLSP